MSWFVLGILSALFLGCYDVCKKQSLRNNHVIIVLTISVCISSIILLPLPILSRLMPDSMQSTLLYVPVVDIRTHCYILIKSALVLSSWIFAYMAMKHLPITIVTPVNATRPMWTLLGALIIFGEQLNGWQWAGVIVCLISFYAFSLAGKREGVSFSDNKWVWALILGTLLGASSGLYDKYLMRRFDHNAVQVYYTIYQSFMMLIVCALSTRHKIKKMQPHKSSGATNWAEIKKALDFTPSWAIIGISGFLVASDFVYLLALSQADSLISVLSAVRRSGVIVPFTFGVFVLKDKNPLLKTICLCGVIIGILFLYLGSR